MQGSEECDQCDCQGDLFSVKTPVESVGHGSVYLHTLLAFLDLADVCTASKGQLPERWERMQNRFCPVLLVRGQQNPEHLGACHVELALCRQLVNVYSLNFWFGCFGDGWYRLGMGGNYIRCGDGCELVRGRSQVRDLFVVWKCNIVGGSCRSGGATAFCARLLFTSTTSWACGCHVFARKRVVVSLNTLKPNSVIAHLQLLIM